MGLESGSAGAFAEWGKLVLTKIVVLGDAIRRGTRA
jgi:hypothetical protein